MTKKDKFLAAAQKFLEKGNLEKALAEFQKAAQEDPKDTRTWLRIAEIQTKLGASDAATTVYLKTADLYVEQGFFQRAVAVYKNVLKLSPGHVDAHFKLADIFKQLGLFSDAVQQYEAAANTFTKLGRHKDALVSLRQIVELNPDQPLVRIKLAEAASQAGSVDEAVREFRRAAEQLLLQGKVDDHLRVAERILFHEPEDHALAKEVASQYIDRNNARFALPKLQTVIQAHPRDLEALELLAQACEQLGQTQKLASTLRDLMRIHAAERRPQEARQLAGRIRALAPDDRALLRDVAEVETKLGLETGGPGPRRPEGAPAELGRAPSTGPAPASTIGERLVAVPAAASRQGEEPKAEIDRLLSEADVFAKFGLVERAVEHLRKVVERDPAHVGARERRAALLAKLGQNGAAAAELEALAEQLVGTDIAAARAQARRALELDAGAARARRIVSGAEGGEGAGRFGAPLRSASPSPVVADDDDVVDTVELEDLEEIEEELDVQTPAPVVLTPAPTPALIRRPAGPQPDAAAAERSDASDVLDSGSLFDFVESTRVNVKPLEEEGSLGGGAPFAPPPHDFVDDDAETPPPRRRPPREAPTDVELDSAGFAPPAPGADLDPADLALLPPGADLDSTHVVPPAQADAGAASGVSRAARSWEADFATGEPSAEAEPVPPVVIDPEESEPTTLRGRPRFTSDADAAPAGPLDDDTIPPPPSEESTDEHGPDAALLGELEQVDFFLDQGLVEEAREILDPLDPEHRRHPMVASRIERLATLERDRTATPLGSVAVVIGDDDEKTDRHLVASFDPGVSSGPRGVDPVSLDQTISGRLEAADTAIGAVPKTPLPGRSGRPVHEPAVTPRAVVVGGGAADLATHGDLGIAYKEMGLWDAAIQEFKLLAGDPNREVFALTMIGECHEAKGAAADAVVHYKRALNLPQITEAESTQLYYQLGNVFQTLGDRNEALFFFEKVSKRDAKFRDVTKRVSDLKANAPSGRSAAGPRR